jgi:hypothetical protein
MSLVCELDDFDELAASATRSPRVELFAIACLSFSSGQTKR